MKILTDVDGVLLNWIGPFHDWMARQGHIAQSVKNYEISVCYPDLTREDSKAVVETFNASATMGFLPPLEDAVAGVKYLYENYGVVFHCITSMGHDPYARRLREMNLREHFGNAIAGLTILGCGEDKTNELSKYQGTDMIWLEDHVGNACAGSRQGLKTFLFNRAYNKAPADAGREPFIRVKNWKDLLTNLKVIFPREFPDK